MRMSWRGKSPLAGPSGRFWRASAVRQDNGSSRRKPAHNAAVRAHGAVGDPVTIRYAVSMETSTQNGSGDRSIPPNDSLGGIKANKDNDPYGLAIREGVSTSESSGGRTKR